MSPLRLLPFAALTAVLLTGCAGYHLGSATPKRMNGIKTIAVPTFRNSTLIPRLETLAASTVVAEFQRDGTFAIRSSNKADAVLEGTITQITRSGVRSVRSDILQQQEYTLTVKIRYTITRTATGERIEEADVIGETSFFVSSNDISQDERQALPIALQQAATRLVSRISTGW